MTTSYYHVAPSPTASAIESHGLQPTDAAECPSGVGVHLTRDLVDARYWCDRLRAERGDHDVEYTIFEVTLPDTVSVVTDEFPGNGPDGAVVACTTTPIPPENITPVEWL